MSGHELATRRARVHQTPGRGMPFARQAVRGSTADHAADGD